MEWLTQNWILVAAAVGIFLLMRRGGMGCGHAGGGHHGGARHDAPHGAQGDAPPAGPAEQLTDPVSGKAVDPSHAVTALHRGTPVYFESRENRDRFEAAPDQFPIAQPAPARRQRHGGC